MDDVIRASERDNGVSRAGAPSPCGACLLRAFLAALDTVYGQHLERLPIQLAGEIPSQTRVSDLAASAGGQFAG